MFRLTIITINRNNAVGLEQTMQSVLSQTSRDFDYVVVDGASTDGSVDVVRHFADLFGERLTWVSEPDTGIYNAMNKGIRMAKGDYLQFLNSGDFLAADDVTERMLTELDRHGNPSMLYGNLIKRYPDGRKALDKGYQGRRITMLDMYLSTMHHNATYIKRSLFEVIGLYNENLKIGADWEWFLRSVILGGEKPEYTDINVLVFDMTGISSTNPEINKQEREYVLSALFPEAVLEDYKSYSFVMDQMRRVENRPWMYRLYTRLKQSLTRWESKRYERKCRIRDKD